MTDMDLNGQPTQDPANTQTVDKVYIDWVGEVDLDELKRWYLRQSDYTKKTTELANQRREIEASQEDLNAINALKQFWFATTDDIQKKISELQEQSKKEFEFNSIINANPEIERHAEAIKIIQKTTNEPIEDIIEKYGFWQKDKLKKIVNNRVIPSGWIDTTKTVEKDFDQMSIQEFEAWNKANGVKI